MFEATHVVASDINYSLFKQIIKGNELIRLLNIVQYFTTLWLIILHLKPPCAISKFITKCIIFLETYLQTLKTNINY